MADLTGDRDRAGTGPRSQTEPEEIHAFELPHNRPLSHTERLIDFGFLAFALVIACIWALQNIQ